MSTKMIVTCVMVSCFVASPGAGQGFPQPPAPPQVPAAQPPPAPVNVRLNVNGQGVGFIGPIACPPAAGCTAPVPSGRSVTLRAVPAAGWLFTGWSGACSGTGANCQLTPQAATTATATFARPKLTVVKIGTGRDRSSLSGSSGSTVALPGGNLSCPAGCTEHTREFNVGTAVVLTARGLGALINMSGCAPTPGSTEAVSSCRVVMNGDTTVTVDHRLPRLNVFLNGDGASAGTVVSADGSAIDCSGTVGGPRCTAEFPVATVVELRATSTASGFLFFQQDARPRATSPVLRITIRDDTSVVAAFGTLMTTLNLVVSGNSGTITVTGGGTARLACTHVAAPTVPTTQCSVSLPIGTLVGFGGPPAVPVQWGGNCASGQPFSILAPATCMARVP